MGDRLRGATLAFDLDGTLVDSAPDLIDAVNFVLAELGRPAVDPALLRPDISLGAKHMLRHALALGAGALPQAEIERLYDELYLPRYEATIADASRPFPGLIEALDSLEAAGCRFVVCTNKWEHLSRKLLTALDIAGRFGAIAGRDTFAVCKPHPDHLIKAVQAVGGDPARAVMIGDSDTDVQTAKRAGMPVVGVTFGYTTIPMTELAATATIDTFADLEPAVRKVLSDRRRES